MLKISIVIPLYNKKSHIKQTLNSALNQTYESFEIIIVDDGSTDNSLDEINNIQDKRIKIIKQKNSGVSSARNTGIREAKGQFIAFLDADDIWEENYLEEINNLIIKYNECDIFVSAYKIILPNGRINYSETFDTELDNGLIESYWETLKYKYEFVWTSAMVVRKSTLNEVSGFNEDEIVGEDLDLISRIAQINKRVAYSSKVCVEYNRTSENNARNRIKVAYPKAYINLLENEMNNSKRTITEISAITSKYNKKMIAYIFTLILNGNRKKARNIIQNWTNKDLKLLKKYLVISSFLPSFFNNIIFGIRMKIF